MPLIADIAVAMLMQVTADDEAHIGSTKLVEESRPNQWHDARRTRDIVGWMFEKEGLVQEQRGGRPRCSTGRRATGPVRVPAPGPNQKAVR